MPDIKFNLDMNGLDDIMRDMDALSSREINYGFPDENRIHSEAKVPVGTVAFWQDRGTKNSDGSWHIPPRPFLSQESALVIENNMDNYTQLVMGSVGHGKKGVLKKLNNVGKDTVEVVKKAIDTGIYVPLAPSTIQKKGHSKPLLDTKEMYNNIEFKIRINN